MLVRSECHNPLGAARPAMSRTTQSTTDKVMHIQLPSFSVQASTFHLSFPRSNEPSSPATTTTSAPSTVRQHGRQVPLIGLWQGIPWLGDYESHADIITRPLGPSLRLETAQVIIVIMPGFHASTLSSQGGCQVGLVSDTESCGSSIGFYLKCCWD